MLSLKIGQNAQLIRHLQKSIRLEALVTLLKISLIFYGKIIHRFNYFEECWITIGVTKKEHILVVANLFFSDEGEEIIE